MRVLVALAWSLLVVVSGDAAGAASDVGSHAWLVYKTSLTLPKNYGCADVPKQLDRLRTWPGGGLPSKTSTVDDPVWSPDGRQIAFAGGDTICTNGDGVGQSAARIGVVDATGGSLHWVTGGGSSVAGAGERLDLSPSWSPDGRRIAFARFNIALGSGGIYIVGSDGRGLTRVSSRTALSLDWSPDGRSIAFIPGDRLYFAYSAANRVAMLDIRSRRIHTYQVSNPYDLSWSPNGDEIAVTGTKTILILDTGGKVKRSIPIAGKPGRWLNGVTWAPNGLRIAYSYGNTIFTVGVNGHAAKRIVAGTAPDWRP